ncbi:MAG: hypothetical protein IJ636_07835 [Bacteroidales bacterium]|nr:hypothetical protein [Bacteroidales bacterium]
MKRLFFSLLAVLLCTGAFAQTSVTTPSQNLKLQFKGARTVGNDVELTVLLTNLSANEVVINLVGGMYQTGMAGSVAYDNDGNVYELGNVLVSVGNKSFTDQYCAGSFPGKVAVKCHVLVKNVAREASSLSKLKLCLLCPQLDIRNTGICFEINDVNFK